MERIRRERSAERASTALSIVLATLLLQAVALAQSAQLIAEIVPLDERPLPVGLRWLRTTLATFGESPVAADRPVRLRLNRDGTLTTNEVADLDLGDDALRFSLEIDGEGLVRGACDRSGHETWWADPELDFTMLPPELRRLVERFGYEAATGWLTIDLGATIGNLTAAAAEGDPASEALTIGTAECGTLATLARRTRDGTWRIDGSSDGGLLLPTLLVLLADRHSGNEGAKTDTPLASDVDRWILMAASARADEQAEAARQLGRFRDPRAIDSLERLLRGDANLRMTAMHSLVRLHSTSSVAAIARAADPKFAGSVEFAARAIWSLLPPDLVSAMQASASPEGVAVVREPSLSPLQWDLPQVIAALCGAFAVVCLFALAGLNRRSGARLVTPSKVPA